MKQLEGVAYAFFLLTAGLPASVSGQTLADAVDNTALVWTTSPSNAVARPWVVKTDVISFDGIDSASSNIKNLPDTTSWIETTVVGPGTISYWCKVSCQPPEFLVDEWIYYDYFVFEIGGVEVDRIEGSGLPWQFRTFPVPAGTNQLRWTYSKDFEINDADNGIDAARLDQVRYEPDLMPLGKALGTCGLDWTSGATTNLTMWVGQTNVSYDGSAAVSADAPFNEESWLRVTVAGVSNVSFLWRVSSRTNADYLEFYTNSYVHNPASPPINYAARISGEVTAWRSNFFKLSASATNTLTWRYAKSSQAVVGQNRGWLDQVKFNPDTNRAPYSLATPTKLPDGSFQFALVGKSNCPCRVEVSTNLLNWTTLTDVFTTNSSTTVLDPGAANVGNRFYRGNTQ